MAEKKYSFEDGSKRLDEILQVISNQTLSLDESLKLYEEGKQIIKQLEDELKESEKKIEKVVGIK